MKDASASMEDANAGPTVPPTTLLNAERTIKTEKGRQSKKGLCLDLHLIGSRERVQ